MSNNSREHLLGDAQEEPTSDPQADAHSPPPNAGPLRDGNVPSITMDIVSSALEESNQVESYSREAGSRDDPNAMVATQHSTRETKRSKLKKKLKKFAQGAKKVCSLPDSRQPNPAPQSAPSQDSHGDGLGYEGYIGSIVQLDHFKLLRVVGKGAFGKVRIVERKDNGDTFALKYIRKDEVVRQENVRNIIRERKMLEHLNHPFLCNLRYSFQDYEYLYLVVDLMTGGDLRFHITRRTFEERTIRFWMAELGCALRYVHEQGIVHRDVKPDNVLLDAEGHVHLADFNVAADYTNPRKQLSSKSGTLAYLAPEVYETGPYRDEVDWWSLGVVMYECLYGKRPFEGKSQDDLGNKIKTANPKYPLTEPKLLYDAVDATQRLLCKRVKDRIGATSWESFTDHPFFSPIDFVRLERKEIPPVFIPSSEKTNFDATYDLEELLLEEAPLEARARHQKPRPKLKENASDQEKRAAELHEMIEKYFEPFDYRDAAFDKVSVETQSTNSTRGQSRVRELEKLVTDDPSPSRSQTPAPPGSNHTGSPPMSTTENTVDVGREETGRSTSRPRTRPSSPDSRPPRVPPKDAPSPARSPAPRGPGTHGNTSLGRSHSISISGSKLQKSSTAESVEGRSRANTKGEAQPKAKKGIVGFLSRQKDRGKSPSGGKKYPEGVLGKEGCRVWIKD